MHYQNNYPAIGRLFALFHVQSWSSHLKADSCRFLEGDTAGNVEVVTLNGRALALHASVTLVNTVINVPAP